MQKIANIAIVIMATCVIVLTGVVVHREFFTGLVASPGMGPIMRHVDHSETLADAGHVFGLATAPIKIVEFADFQCPFCAAAEEPLRSMVQHSQGRVALVYRNYPLTQLHRYALEAAIAAECASDQGRFAAYHDALYHFQDSLGVWTWSKYAQIAAVADTLRLEDCVSHQRTLSKVQRDRAVGDSIHVSATPTFIAGGELFVGMPSDSVWRALLGVDR